MVYSHGLLWYSKCTCVNLPEYPICYNIISRCSVWVIIAVIVATMNTFAVLIVINIIVFRSMCWTYCELDFNVEITFRVPFANIMPLFGYKPWPVQFITPTKTIFYCLVKSSFNWMFLTREMSYFHFTLPFVSNTRKGFALLTVNVILMNNEKYTTHHWLTTIFGTLSQ